MSDNVREEVTRLLGEIAAGNENAKEQLLEAVYGELHGLAASMMRRERPDHTLQPTALVNEAVLRLLESDAQLAGKDRAYFFGAMATAMRRVLVDHARAHRTQRRGGGHERQPLDQAVELVEAGRGVDLIALDDALNRLQALNSRQCEVVVLRFFGGLSVPEIAQHLGMGVSTVEKDWRLARAWLQRQIGEGP
jgi:RNA polymerase sigma factor (TIGR02999 family)